MPFDGQAHELDIRDSHRYHAAFVDPATKREICRDGEYKTGLVLKLRSLPIEGTEQPIEVLGMVSLSAPSMTAQNSSAGPIRRSS